MSRAQFRFYGELNDFLPSGRKHVAFGHGFDGQPAIKDTIEAIGVPHPEVEVIVVNGEAVDFAYRLRDGDRVSVYPSFEAIDIPAAVRVGPPPLPEVRFVLDTHLGRLAAYLRMLGLDTLYRNDYGDEELAHLSSEEERVLLTKDRGLLKRGLVTYGYYVRSPYPRRQLAEIVRRFDLFDAAKPFQRCIRCNSLLEPTSRDVVQDRVPPRILRRYAEFRRCPSCDSVYWKGSHHGRMLRFIAQVLDRSALGPAR